MGSSDSPDFSGLARGYSISRPGYPEELYAWLASLVERHDVAWDTATGSGQAAVGLARHFDRVIATDRSAEQIRHGHAHPRVEYRTAPSEESGIDAGSVDLAGTAAAIHWFDLPRFYEELRRVVRPGGIAAAWTYHIGHVAPPFDALFDAFLRDHVREYFGSGAKLVDDRYAAIELPGEAIEAPAFETSARWTHAQVIDFVRTWSGVAKYIEVTGRDPVPDFADKALEVWGDPHRSLELRWPLYLRVSRL